MIADATLRSLAAEAGLSGASIVVERIDGAGRSLWRAELDGDRPTYPASMIKVPIALALAHRCAAGTARLEQRVTVDAANMTANDAPSPFVPGYAATLGDLAHAMLAASDNVATNVLIDALGRERIGETCRELGLARTAVRRKLSGSLPLIDDAGATGRNQHPAADAAAALRFLAACGPDAAAWGFVLAALRAQIWNGKLSRGWAPGDAFAHKTGDTDEVSHDGGVLTLGGGRRFVVVVYTELPSSPESDERFGAFARLLRPSLAA